MELRLTERRVNIVSDGIDLAVRMGALEDSDLVARRLCQVTRRLVASSAYLERAGLPTVPADLGAHKAILTSAALDTWRFDGGWDCAMRWSIAAGNMLVAHQLTLLGNGIALLPDFMIEAEVARGDLTVVLPDHPMPAADAWIVSTAQRYKSPAVQAVLNGLVGAFDMYR